MLDASVLIAREVVRRLDTDSLPDETAVSVVTLAELHAGVLGATETITRARRLAEEGRGAKVNDLCMPPWPRPTAWTS